MLLRMGPSSRSGNLLDAPCRYQIVVRGTLDAGWSDRLGGMAISTVSQVEGTPATILLGELADQSALVGVLNTLHDLGLPLVSVERIVDAV